MMPKSLKHRFKKHRTLMVLSFILVLFGVWRLPGPPLGRSGVPLGATVVPRGAPGRKSWLLASPLAAQNEVIFGSVLHKLVFENTSKNIFIFWCIFGWILNGFWIHFGCFLGWFFVDFFYPIFDVILYGFLKLSAGPQPWFYNILYAKMRFWNSA